MSSISWSNTAPSSASTGGDVERDWLSMLTSFSRGVGTSFQWPGSAGGSLASAGEMQLGSLRAAHAGGGTMTGGFGDGYLSLNTDHVSLHHIGSSQTGVVGHSGVLAYASNSTLTQRYLLQSGSYTILSVSALSADSVRVTFTTPYALAPIVWLTQQQGTGPSNASWLALSVQSPVATSGFTSTYSMVNTPIATNVYWFAEGLAGF